MICKKCKTAVSETDKKCPNCGAPLRLNANHKSWLAALVLIMVLLVLAIYYMNANMRANPPAGPEATEQAAAAPPVAEDTADPPSEPVDIAETAEPTAPAFTEDPGKSDAEIAAIVQNTASAAEKYRSAYCETSEFVSRNGMLYDFPAEMYISTGDFKPEDGFNQDYAGKDVLILYVKAADMPAELTVGENLDRLTVFAACRSGNGYMVSNGVKSSKMTAEAMKAVLNRYSADHGPIEYVRGNTETFMDAVRALVSEPGLEGPLDIRYMAEDGEYVSAVVSPRGDTTLIKEFVLLKGQNGCEIYLDKIETQWQKFVAINEAAPDINLDLIPKYNLCRDTQDLKTDFTALLNSMVSTGVVSSGDGPPVFISGNAEFVFMEFPGGAHMLAHNDDGRNDWKVYKVSRYEDAVLRMGELSKFNPPPYFLIKQN